MTFLAGCDLNRSGIMPRYFTARHAFTRDPNEEGKYHDYGLSTLVTIIRNQAHILHSHGHIL
jgi:hypothetical protein